jgi:hypothetical protein
MTPTAAAALSAAKAADIAYVEAIIVATHDARGTSCIVYNLFPETVTELETDGYTVTDETIDGVIYYTIDWSTPV